MVATESLAATKRLAFKTEVAKGLPYGLGDEQRLTQVLLNLVGNAIKFTDAGEVRIAARAANGHFTVSVSDTGPGIPTEECERIFEKFFRVEHHRDRGEQSLERIPRRRPAVGVDRLGGVLGRDVSRLGGEHAVGVPEMIVIRRGRQRDAQQAAPAAGGGDVALLAGPMA